MTSSAHYRRWTYRLLKTAGVVLLVFVAAVILVVAINRFDEPLERSTQAWLDFPVRAASPEPNNGYLALLALDARAANPIAAAGEVARAQHVIFADAQKSHQDTVRRYRELRARLLNPTGARIPLVADCKDDCPAYVLSHAMRLEKLSRDHADLLQRYSKMLDFPAYAEDIPIDPAKLPPNYGLAGQLGLMHLGNAAIALERGDAQMAYREWARHQRFWEMAAAGSLSLIDLMSAVDQIERGQTMLSHMLASHPDSAALARRHALPVLAERLRVMPLIARSRVYEFQMQAYVFTDLIFHISLNTVEEGRPTGLIDRLALLFYQRNASVNLLHRLHQSDMSRNGVELEAKIPPDDADAQIDQPCESNPNRRMLLNPIGKLLLCTEGSFAYRAYYERIAKADAAATELERKIRAVR